ncbi:hypothetical protein MCEMRE196_00050 [Candidatus Nanopelagicaceae bacterium]
MSTTIKRIALVAVAALSLGVVSVAPSTAAQSAAQSFIFCSQGDGGAIANTTTTGATCGGVAGSSNYVLLTSVSQAKDVEISVSGSTFATEEAGFVINTAGTVATLAGGSAAKKIRVATPAAGTITVTVKTATAGTGIFAASTETVVITVGTAALSGIYSAANSSVYLVGGETWTATADATTAPTKASTYVAGDSATASIVVTYLDGLKKGITGDSITATITSGPGTILTAASAGKFDTTTALTTSNNLSSTASVGKYTASVDVDASTGVAAFYLFANGQVGTSVVTIKNSAGTVLGTKSVVFTSTTVASIEATVVKNFVQGDTTGATGGVIKLVLKDAAGNAMSSVSAYPTAKSSDATIASATQSVSGYDTATVSSTGAVYWGITPAAAASYGPVTITFTAGTVTATATVTLSSAVAATFTASAAGAAANGDVVYTVTAKDAKGYAVPDGLALSNYVASVASVGTAGSLSAQTGLTDLSKSGVWTTTAVSAPSSSTEITTTFTLTGTAGTANSYLAKTLTATKVAATFAVTNPGLDAATDAANEAAQAASDATDAALAAADAADAATTKAQEAVDAVATLSAQVSKLITALKAQITTLTNLVIKIQKKVKA